jgi:type IV pilus assembly protein PilO
MIEFLRGKVTPPDMIFAGVVVAVAAAIFAGYYLVLHSKMQEEHATLRKELTEVQNDLRQAREFEANIDSLREEARKWEELVTTFEQRLPDEREIPQLMRKFERLGYDSGLRVELSQLRSTKDTRKETIPYQVKAFGNFHQILEFINQLERHDRYLKISELNIEEEEAGVSEASFVLSTYRFIKATPPAEAPVAAKSSGGARK